MIAKENGCHSIGFPLISAGVFDYPKEQAWEKAILACRNFIRFNLDYPMEIIFAVRDERILQMGERILEHSDTAR